MSDPIDFDPIAASLRRQFSPPSLDALEQQIASEAERMARQQAHPVAVPLAPAPPERTPTWPLVLTVALAVAAAVLLLLMRPWSPDPTTATGRPVAETLDPEVVVPPTNALRAGAQLEGFLRRGDGFAADETDCSLTPPPEVCGTDARYPQLLPSPSVRQLGECGGDTSTDCADFDLPADRALLVQLEPGGNRAIVCIERPWTDPHPVLPAGSGYRIFRRELGDHVLYEITPLDEPRALDKIRL